jgi:uncharacterized phage protein (TIGR01671 family)
MTRRELKFRVWNSTKSKFISYGSDLCDICYEYESGLLSFGDDTTIQQFTGFKDNNGKNVYEGDLIKVKLFEKWTDDSWYSANHQVFYNSNSGSFVHAKNPLTFASGIRFDPYTFDPLEFEVIGNIF